MALKRIEPGKRMSSAVIHGNMAYLAGFVAESAAGKFPVEAVSTMNRIGEEVERDPIYRSVLTAQRPEPENTVGQFLHAVRLPPLEDLLVVEGIAARGVLVVLDAKHDCVMARGSRQVDASAVTVSATGSFAVEPTRSAVLGLIGSDRV